MWLHVPRVAPRSAGLASLRSLVYRGGTAADCRTNQRTLLAADDAADAGATSRRSADDHRGLAPRAFVLTDDLSLVTHDLAVLRTGVAVAIEGAAAGRSAVV